MTHLLLDTHVLVWFAEGSAELKPALVGRIEEAVAASETHVSVFSFWEVAILVARNRLTLDRPIDLWADSVSKAPGFDITPLSPAIAIESTRLPGNFHKDPADQIIVATARFFDCPLVTSDSRILSYSHVKTVAR